MNNQVTDRITDLLRPEVFPHPARAPRLIETHISWVILVGNFAYKLRKPVNFGFLDFSTLEQRRADCEAEVRLNRRLCPDLYLGVVDVCERGDRLTMDGPGTPVEPAVLMRRLPGSGMLPTLLERDLVDERLMGRIARQLAAFHNGAATGPGVDEHGSLAAIRANWDENFAQATTVDSDLREGVRTYVQDFLTGHAELIERRVRNGRIRDGHGDLHAGSVCVTRRRLYLFDCIEFNNRFRCGDVAADVAFLAMDLDHLGRADLSNAFVDAYVRASGDQDLLTFLVFYKCYRAFVRGKVLSFRFTDPALHQAEAERIADEAGAYFDLAYTYASRPAQPMLLVTMGMPASGKTTLAHALSGRLGLVHLSSDVVRKHLAGWRPTSHQFEGFERGLYSRSMTRRMYAVLMRKAARWLHRGRSVVLDATFGRRRDRAALRQLARRTGAQLIVLMCRADESLIRQRLAARATDTSSTSDARLELWPALHAAFVEPSDLPMALNADANRPLRQVVADMVAAIRSSQPELARSPAAGRSHGSGMVMARHVGPRHRLRHPAPHAHPRSARQRDCAALGGQDGSTAGGRDQRGTARPRQVAGGGHAFGARRAEIRGDADGEALLDHWLVPEGAHVTAGQPLAEAVIVKSNVEVTAPADGVLARVLVPNQATFARGQDLAVLDETALV